MKKSSYNKLKDKIKGLENRNLGLRQDIHELVKNPNSFRSQIITMGVHMEGDLEKAVWLGESSAKSADDNNNPVIKN